jgi:hypothetical protein
LTFPRSDVRILRTFAGDLHFRALSIYRESEMKREDKKTYTKPELKTRKVELGVFGDYGSDAGGGGGDGGRNGIDIVRYQTLRLE